MGKHLSERQFHDYKRTGCIFPLTIMSMEEARQHRMRLERAETERGNMHYIGETLFGPQLGGRNWS
jgi:hypothetical protein